MSIVQSVPGCCRLACLLLMVFAGACSLPPKPSENPYERPVIGESTDAGESGNPAVSQLQNQALAAINESQYPLAMDYLQRAIKIEPRDAWSWHYLAEIHWRRGELERCQSMLQRSQAYAGDDDRLDDANRALQARCQ